MAHAKFLHTADLHLSRPFGFLPPNLAEERRLDQRRTLARIVDIAIERAVDIVLFSGDIFDDPDPDPTDLEAVIREFTRLTENGKRIFAIPGNHDYIRANSFWHRLNISGLHVFADTEWSSVTLEDLGVSICGIAFDRSKPERRAFHGISIDPALKSIVMVHASYESFGAQLDRYHPFSSTELADANASYVALGHYHKFNPIVDNEHHSCGCYPGTPEGISFDAKETGNRYVVLGEIGDDMGTSIEPVKVNQKTMRSEEFDCTSFQSEAGLLDAIRSVCERNSLIQVKLGGIISPSLAPTVSALPERFRESCHYMSLDTSGLSMLTDLPDADLTIRGRFCKYILDQIDHAADPERARLLRKALELGLASLGGGTA